MKKMKRLLAFMTAGILAAAMLTMPVRNLPSPFLGGTEALSFGGLVAEPITAEAASGFRRVVDNEHPMWIVHIDSWNYADPEKIIELVPEDVLPYVV